MKVYAVYAPIGLEWSSWRLHRLVLLEKRAKILVAELKMQYPEAADVESEPYYEQMEVEEN